MNGIALIIIGALVGERILNWVADRFNLKNLSHELPREFASFYEADRYRQSQKYLKVHTKFGWFASCFNMVLLLVFWFAEGFPLLDRWVRGLEFGPILSGLIFIGALLLAKGVLSLPFNLYHTFGIEARFGFNKTTIATYVLDLLKGLVLAIVLGAPLLAAILAFFEYTGPHAWWICWIGITIYMLLVQFIAPAWIMPLFNKFTPLDEGSSKRPFWHMHGKLNFHWKMSIKWTGHDGPPNRTLFLPVSVEISASYCLIP